MTTQPTPHIGATLAQRAILRYRLEQRELDAERDRLERTTAALQVDAMLDRVRQPEPANFCAPADDVPPALTGRQLAAVAALWLAAMLGALWLCTDAGTRFLDAIWRLS
ncbi:hypothetical protein RHOFW510R12_01380 [Rhodanobacter sp. FW510-R12]|uniref:hypothetical protein n=1 Tax=unclassified Rhodanobacter TaxID=2621553 RepID=UPI0007AA46B5|nr:MULTISPECIES: hypothetical protein [unclassified Rhodanobacter]KZC17044.1 hypothetical protein RHOFW104R8_13465 [Rhodanobacter sp. FW104-R8]KZC28568.1 hypothetical protein RhoFW510T8_10705 [Rhodanobacter sp. FW510-T8]KZC32330.1 hypothetical protein RhoFW510R10_12925 [Rhodanobacter sp. FW510-R10]